MRYLVTNREYHFEKYGIWSDFCSLEDAVKHIDEFDILALDCETSGLSFLQDEMRCLQIGTPDGVQYVFDMEESPYNLWEPIDISVLKEKLENTPLIGHNLLFDLVWLLKHDIRCMHIKDTYLGFYLLTAGLLTVRRNLAAVQLAVLGSTNMDKGQRDSVIKIGMNSTDNINYSCEDVDLNMFKLHDAIEAKLKEWGMERAWSLENKFSPVLAYMEFCGFYMNPDKWEAKVEKTDLKFYLIRERLYETLKTQHPVEYATYFDINWGSPKQVVQLFEVLGIDVIDPKTEKKTVNATHLKKYDGPHEIVSIYLEYKALEKDRGTYGRNWLEYPMSDGRIHTKTSQMVATGRIASGNVKKGDFPNLANVPAGVATRGCFEGQRSNVLCVNDYSGQESVILADFSQVPSLLEFYASGGGDLHSYAARAIWPDIIGPETPLKDVKRNFPELRQKAKAANFAIAYGGNGFTIANNLNIPVEQGDEIYEKYLAAFPGLSEFFDRQKKKAYLEGSILVSPYTGRRRFIEGFDEWKEKFDNFDRKRYARNKKQNTKLFQDTLQEECRKLMRFKSAFERDALNSPMQGMGSEMSKTAGILFYQWIIDEGRVNKVKIVNFIYDEWVVECAKRSAPKVNDALKECMEKASTFFLQTIPKIPVGGGISKQWEH